MAYYTQLRAWQVSHELAKAVAEITRVFPREERFELTSQLRRAALSVPTNLAEGQARFGSREALRHARIAAGSLAEVDYLLLFAHECGYLPKVDYVRLLRLRRHASRLVYKLSRALDDAAR